MDCRYLSLNQMTTERWGVREAVDGCARAGIGWIGLWRHKVQEIGVTAAAKIVRDAGLHVSGLCRGGMFPAGSSLERARRIEDNRRAIVEAAELGTDVLVLVCGPPEDCTLDDARRMVEEGIAELIPYAREHGVKLGIEPLHPMFAADRSVISTLGQANDIVQRLQSGQVGVVIDVYHVWWDPNLYEQIDRCAGHIFGFHVNDWLAPVQDALMSRGMMGDGCIEIGHIRSAVEEAGYSGPVEVEIFNRKIWDTPGDDVLALMKERFAAVV
ncbi:sugar phosphate isomerase/epimerase family protein [Alicyclobacillus shizuokensis]|uniref:sugar phosphate isomerase/epimerase family protein n=1 Tax=Alicyclobacillus shizuokensis TaxID=392014 RepID=UPI000829DA7D|nr:sugar phosphate isomerase/epimerase family protein [Alicyclobacillus shizuokensis]MCL6625491.1 sugar phosphate isomerase/epimerase [Alicyclobacillus shizuokensis]